VTPDPGHTPKSTALLLDSPESQHAVLIPKWKRCFFLKTGYVFASKKANSPLPLEVLKSQTKEEAVELE